jgi:hypothetical protein
MRPAVPIPLYKTASHVLQARHAAERMAAVLRQPSIRLIARIDGVQLDAAVQFVARVVFSRADNILL